MTAPSLQWGSCIYAGACPRCHGAVEYRNEDPFTRSLECLNCSWQIVKVTPLSGRNAGPGRVLSDAERREASAIKGRSALALWQQGLTYRQIAAHHGVTYRQVRWWIDAARDTVGAGALTATPGTG